MNMYNKGKIGIWDDYVYLVLTFEVVLPNGDY